MADTKNFPLIKQNENVIPCAFSHCANCGVSYLETSLSSSGPIESVLLVCLHSFCRNCINNGCLRSEKGDPNLVTCCKCKCNSNRADCGINLLADLDGKLHDSSAKKTIRCSSCSDQMVATSRCTICNDMLCDACVLAHKRVKLTRDHMIISLQNGASSTLYATKVSKRYSCAKHATEKLQYFCDRCNKVTCQKCHEMGSEHYNHTSMDVNNAALAFRENLQTQLSNLKEKEINVSRALDIVNEKMTDVAEAENKALDHVKDYYNSCMEALRLRMNILGNEIKKAAVIKKQQLEKMKEDVGQLQSRLAETIKAVSFVAESGDPIAILSVKKGLAHHMSTLLKLKCQVPNPSHKLDIQLQTDPHLISQVIPSTGRILVDNQTVNGAHGSPPQANTNTSTNASHSPNIHTGPVNHINNLTNNNTSHVLPALRTAVTGDTGLPPTLTNTGQTGIPTTHINTGIKRHHKTTPLRIPSPATGHTIHHRPQISTSPGATRYNTSVVPVASPIPVGVPLVSPSVTEDSHKDSLNVGADIVRSNGDIHPGLPVSKDLSYGPLDPSLRISSVMSLASETNGTWNDDRGHTTPPKDKEMVAKKRKKTPLSPFHISSHHRPDDPNEDYCAVCHNGGELICCDTCPKVYHATCHVPELTGAPSSFSCSLCWDEKPIPVEPDPVTSLNKRKAPSGLTDHEVKICEKILLKMFCHKRSIAFHLPVPKTVKHYSSIIKQPMDLVTIRSKLRRQHFNHYDNIPEFIKDMRLVFSNCVAFNGPLSEYTESAKQVQDYFTEQIAHYFPDHADLAASILPAEEVMNMGLVKKRTSIPDEPLLHIA